MIDHYSTHATDFEATRAFYDAVLAPLGYRRNVDLEHGGTRISAYGPGPAPILWLIETDEPATPRHVAFHAEGRDVVQAFHAAALEAGAEDNGPPGLRPQYHPGYYAAYAFDPDGNNIEAVFHDHERMRATAAD